jgi:predicted dehydrogenase
LKTLNVAVIGAGHLGRIHARLLKEQQGVRLVGISDPLAEARNRVAAECGTEACGDYRDLLGSIDAAVVATPTRLHHAVGRELLSRGIHCLIEKPLAANLAEAEELVVVARRKGVVLQVGHIERFNPALVSVRPQIEDPRYIEAVRCSGYTFRSTDIGVVLDLMIHDLDVVLSLVRSPLDSIDALGATILGGQEDVAQARLVFRNGCVANLSASRVSYRQIRQMQIWSRGGFAGIDFATRSATLVRPSESVLQGTFQPETLSPERKAYLKEHLFEELLPLSTVQCEATNALADELRDFVGSIRGEHDPRVTGEQGRDALAVAEQILAKIGHGWIVPQPLAA